MMFRHTLCGGIKYYSVLTRFMTLNTSAAEVRPDATVKPNNISKPEYDIDYFCNPSNRSEIEENIKKRKSTANIKHILELNDRLKQLEKDSDEYTNINSRFQKELGKVPNKLHSSICNIGGKPHFLHKIGTKVDFKFKAKAFNDISKHLRIAKCENLSNFTNQRSYYFFGQLAEMETALIKYSLRTLLAKNFQLISVPDILNKQTIESCGMDTEGERTQVYFIDPEFYGKDLCLSGTSEMAIADYLMNKSFDDDELPLRLAAVSRCFRAETSKISEERGIFRVHHFTKVEMFGVSVPEKSDDLLEEFRQIEESFFESLGLHFQVLDMAPNDLGNQACRKYDIEAWMPGKEMFGEVSSCSNCTDYQSRRLNIKTGDTFAHTVNGTACAIPRVVIALLETHQNKDSTVNIPKVLQPYMGGCTKIKINETIPKFKPYRTK